MGPSNLEEGLMADKRLRCQEGAARLETEIKVSAVSCSFFFLSPKAVGKSLMYCSSTGRL